MIDGPFAETKELIAGFWPWQVTPTEEGNESVKRASFADSSDRTEIDILEEIEVESFDAEFTSQVSEQEEHLRAQSERQSTS